jgi:hypothetical protein
VSSSVSVAPISSGIIGTIGVRGGRDSPDLTGWGKTALRGSFGSMYERAHGNDFCNTCPDAPFNALSHSGAQWPKTQNLSLALVENTNNLFARA